MVRERVRTFLSPSHQFPVVSFAFFHQRMLKKKNWKSFSSSFPLGRLPIACVPATGENLLITYCCHLHLHERKMLTAFSSIPSNSDSKKSVSFFLLFSRLWSWRHEVHPQREITRYSISFTSTRIYGGARAYQRYQFPRQPETEQNPKSALFCLFSYFHLHRRCKMSETRPNLIWCKKM